MTEDRGPGVESDGDDRARAPAAMALDLGPAREPGWMSAARRLSLALAARSDGVPATTTLRLIGTLVKRVLLIGVILVGAAAFALYLLVRDLL